MFKEKLMSAVKEVAEAYNGGMSADRAVAKVASARDFNEEQTNRLVEMINTTLAIGKEKDAEDPTGSCELASKDNVRSIMMSDDGLSKSAEQAADVDYSFYSGVPGKRNKAVDARAIGVDRIVKAASANLTSAVPEEMDVCKDSMYRIIRRDISMLKDASYSAAEISSCISSNIRDGVTKVASAIESMDMSDDTVDLFKAACANADVVGLVSEESRRLSSSNGGKYVGMNIFDTGPVDDLLKEAESIHSLLVQRAEFDKKAEKFRKEAENANARMRDIVGLSTGKPAKKNISDMFSADGIKVAAEEPDKLSATKSAIEKMSAFIFTPEQAVDALIPSGVSTEKERRDANERRAIIMADLMSNDPIISEADPEAVTEAYKTMVMTSPRVSLDKAQARAFLRSAVNSVAISSSDAKVLADVDKGTRIANALSTLDSSMKDSNI